MYDKGIEGHIKIMLSIIICDHAGLQKLTMCGHKNYQLYVAINYALGFFLRTSNVLK